MKYIYRKLDPKCAFVYLYEKLLQVVFLFVCRCAPSFSKTSDRFPRLPSFYFTNSPCWTFRLLPCCTIGLHLLSPGLLINSISF